MKVGIDLSSTNTGLVILSDDNELIFHGNFQLWSNNMFNIACYVEEMLFIPYSEWIDKKETIKTGIELADFKNANITNRFNLLAGMIISRMLSINETKHAVIFSNVKLFNSNEWQKFLLDIYKPDIKCIKEIVGYGKYDDGDGYVYEVPIYKEFYQISYGDKTVKIEKNERTLRKMIARLFAKKNCKEYQDTWTEDECDAYCIAYFLPQLRDRTQMHQEVKAKKVQAKKSKVQELRETMGKVKKVIKLKDIVIKYKLMSKLTKAQQRALEKAEMELKEYEKEN